MGRFSLATPLLTNQPIPRNNCWQTAYTYILLFPSFCPYTNHEKSKPWTHIRINTLTHEEHRYCSWNKIFRWCRSTEEEGKEHVLVRDDTSDASGTTRARPFAGITIGHPLLSVSMEPEQPKRQHNDQTTRPADLYYESDLSVAEYKKNI